MASTPAGRRQAIVAAVSEARRQDADATFVAERADGSPIAVDYEDRSLRLVVEDAGRDRLDSLLSEYHVFKVAQPATRRAEKGTVHLSAVTDPKHLADFVDALFREVYGLEEGYSMEIERS